MNHEVRRDLPQIRNDRFERRQVAVNVGNDCYPHNTECGS
jgi:hypothetical protein